MFRNCVMLERDVFVTWKENNVNEQDVELLMKEKNVKKEKRCWVISESNLSQISIKSLTSFNHYAEYLLACIANWLELQSWYARNITSLFENSCSHECSSFAHFLLIVISIFSAICLNIAYEIHSKLSLNYWNFLYWHSIIHHFYLDLFIWLCTVFDLNSIWSSIYHLSLNVHHLQ